ncbi:delta and Notch-like epidermal growth factor-related receptor [Nematostella vectensis]|uniref:delta and Notch-like epidermal growth factor-related receptor n=1 Tax=Nematostella vectensis TaxID=45351 RepID=UPI002076DD2D|nr:delta and Notch-like epidermal growth factor-related receptor [Nematostella vectensis]
MTIARVPSKGTRIKTKNIPRLKMARYGLTFAISVVFHSCLVLSSKHNVDQNVCLPNPCTNGGLCSVNGTNFLCDCPQGYRGDRCEVRPGQCLTNPCVNGICELDSLGNPRCFCIPGFAGRYCDIDEDECASSPCRNGGLCIDQVDSYKCSCKQGTFGLNCELLEEDVQKCVKQCEGGICWRNESKIFQIEWGYGDMLCNTHHSCFGGANNSHSITTDDFFIDVQLLPQQLQIGDSLNFSMDANMAPYVPGIRPYLTGKEEFYHCNQTNGTFLSEDPLGTILITEDTLSKEGIYHFIDNVDTTFRCEFGLRLNVSVKSNKCMEPGSSVYCSNHGQCVTNFSMSSYQCKCCGGFRGEFCEKEDHCFSKPCKNGATCKNKEGDPRHFYTCTCAPGYEGRDCSRVIDMCVSNPCKLNAACTPLVNDFHCSCPRGYTGKTCDTELNACSSSPCENNSTCVNKLDTFKCFCTPGYTGSHCEVNINECASSPCQYGTCIDLIDGYRCYCKPGFGGTNCGLNLNECLSNPCYNGGFCVDEENNYRCDCGHGYRGRHCEEDVDLCKEEGWCVNAISCKDNGNSVDCQCKPGFTGANCAVDIHDCVNNPCMNGGTCKDKVNDFECFCKPGFTGKTCELLDGSRTTSIPSQALRLQLLTEDCHLLKGSVLAQSILKNITSHVAAACNCPFTSRNVEEQTMNIQCKDSISAMFTVQISPVAGHTTKELICSLWSHLNTHRNVLELGHDTFIVGMLTNMSSKCAPRAGAKPHVPVHVPEPSSNLAVTIGSICAVVGLVVAAIVVCCRCRHSRPPAVKKYQPRVEDEMISNLSGDLLSAVAPTPKSMYRTSGGYHNMAFSGRFNPEDPIKSKRV